MRSFTFDLADNDPMSPVAGDLYITAKLVYLITFARPVDSRVWSNRWLLKCDRLGERTEPLEFWPDGDNVVWYSARYLPGETPRQVFAEQEG